MQLKFRREPPIPHRGRSLEEDLMKTLKTHQLLGAASLFVASAFGSAVAQNATQATPASSATTPAQMSTANGTDKTTTYATGQPLPNTDHEGFWGHVNPLARKKWVHRQIDPVKDRVNELDELQAKNANDIKDVDARATAGINRVSAAAQAADDHAAAAASRADPGQLACHSRRFEDHCAQRHRLHARPVPAGNRYAGQLPSRPHHSHRCAEG